MCKLRRFLIMKSITSLVAGGLAMSMLAGCEKSIELERVGGIPDLGVLAVAVRGDLVYAVTEQDALLIVDISTPEEPEVLGRIVHEDSNRIVRAIVAVSGEHAYIRSSPDIMSIVDISQPSQPVKIGQYQSPGTIRDIVIREPYAYLVVAGTPVLVIDVSAPEAPVLVSEVSTSGSTQAMALSGDYAFFAHGASGVSIVDLIEPTAPRLVGTNPDPSGAFDIEIRGAHAYVALDLKGLAVLDISNPEATVLTDFEPVEGTEHMAISEDVAYVATLTSVVALDLSEPDNPRNAGEYLFADYSFWITSVAASPDYVVVGRQLIAFMDVMAGDLSVLIRKN